MGLTCHNTLFETKKLSVIESDKRSQDNAIEGNARRKKAQIYKTFRNLIITPEKHFRFSCI